MLSATNNQIYRNIYSYEKIYPKFKRLIKYDEPLLVRESGWEDRDLSVSFLKKTPQQKLIEDSIRRTKTKITDLVICNEFDLFCTFTFAKDRQDVELLKNRMSVWLKNQKRIRGSFGYLIIPEFHKDKKSIHFHALFKGYPAPLTDSGKKNNQKKTIYNIGSYTHGFSTAVKITDHEKVGSYIKKYITKDMPLFSAKKRYWCSDGLIRPVKIINPSNYVNDYPQNSEVYKHKNLTVYQQPIIV